MDDRETLETQTSRYIRRLIPPRTGILREMEAYAEPRWIPIIKPESAALLSMLVKLSRPERILEIGTAIGYSALLMYEASDRRARVITVERDDAMYRTALEFLRRARADIYVTHAEADDALAVMKDRFDLIFIDAAKGQYPRFFEEATRLLAPGGLIVLDNVLFHGRVADETRAIRKSRAITERMNRFLHELCRDGRFDTAVVPAGDGMAVVRAKTNDWETNDTEG